MRGTHCEIPGQQPFLSPIACDPSSLPTCPLDHNGNSYWCKKDTQFYQEKVSCSKDGLTRDEYLVTYNRALQLPQEEIAFVEDGLTRHQSIITYSHNNPIASASPEDLSSNHEGLVDFDNRDKRHHPCSNHSRLPAMKYGSPSVNHHYQSCDAESFSDIIVLNEDQYDEQ
ncbi:hypothetical protein PCASD_21290 [Puccinia coronata f. sp. avenae]|uniref:Uncharacterized protein n=1 Tax=Puccinia coronata f. sp. avenae TaxID=200324 RepID=A0A2N5TX63_9BASI|nr:hypothetical protein PCASD_21290 [Puccinia coronata f. sp. avenae]